MKKLKWIILDKEWIYLRRKAINIIKLVEVGQTRMSSLEMLSEELVTFKKGPKSLFEKHESTNLISGRKSHRSLAVITVSELLVV